MSGKHTKVAIKYDGVLVADYGIRHDRTAKHGHIPSALHLSESDTIKLARCQISKEGYFAILKKKKILPDDASK